MPYIAIVAECMSGNQGSVMWEGVMRAIRELGSAVLTLCIGATLGAFLWSQAWAGQPLPWQMNFQPPASPIMEDVVALNDYLLIVITAVACFVLGLLGFVMWRFNAHRNPTPATWSHNTPLEILWTVVPVLILLAIAVPSFRLLYRQDHIPPAALTIKVEGHQWYWSYTYPDFDIAFDSTMVEADQLRADQPRLLTADAPVVVPVGRVVRVQLTADDVIHSWAVPALGVRTDTVPGRLNETWFEVKIPGIYYGYCAELCGARHAYMPVVVEAVSQEQFDAWIAEHKVAVAPTGTTGIRTRTARETQHLSGIIPLTGVNVSRAT